MPSISTTLLLAAIALPYVYSQLAPTSPKRGLVYIPSKISANAADDSIWVQPGSDLTWYYNYASTPTQQYNNKLNFVPMSFAIDNNFLSTVQGLINSGMNITHVLGFNEVSLPASVFLSWPTCLLNLCSWNLLTLYQLA